MENYILSILSQLKCSFCLDQTLLHVLGSEIHVVCCGRRKLGAHCTVALTLISAGRQSLILALDAIC